MAVNQGTATIEGDQEEVDDVIIVEEATTAPPR